MEKKFGQCYLNLVYLVYFVCDVDFDINWTGLHNS
jgi:hypothetical protein